MSNIHELNVHLIEHHEDVQSLDITVIYDNVFINVYGDTDWYPHRWEIQYVEVAIFDKWEELEIDTELGQYLTPPQIEDVLNAPVVEWFWY